MTFLIAVPESLAVAASGLVEIGSTLGVANTAAAAPTAGMVAAAADEVSGAIAGLFNSHALECQSLSAEAAAFHARFVAALSAGAQWYASAEASSASALQSVSQQVAGLVNAATGRGGGAVGAAADSKSDATTANSGTSGTGCGGGSSGSTATSGGSTPATGTGGSGGSGSGASATGATSGSGSGTTSGSGTSGAATSATALAAGGTATPTNSAGTGGTGVTATYATSSQWNNGFVANYTITNTGTTPLSNWQLQFNLPAGDAVDGSGIPQTPFAFSKIFEQIATVPQT